MDGKFGKTTHTAISTALCYLCSLSPIMMKYFIQINNRVSKLSRLVTSSVIFTGIKLNIFKFNFNRLSRFLNSAIIDFWPIHRFRCTDSLRFEPTYHSRCSDESPYFQLYPMRPAKQIPKASCN